MSQTPIERLRDYLGQLPPQAQALLMREFERAIERGEDTTVASLVLEQLRKVARRAEQGAPPPPRSLDAARLLFRALEPFLIDGNLPARPGQIRRASASFSLPRLTPSSRSLRHPAATSSARWPGSAPPT